VVFPVSINLKESLRETFIAKFQLFDDTTTRGVARNNRDFESVQVEIIEAVLRQHNNGFWGVALTSARFIDPVTNASSLKRAPLHR
jgi:hypothetical protein